MVEKDAYCMERSNRLVLLNQLETCFTGAVQDGRGVEALAGLVDALKFHDGLTGPGIAAALAADPEPVANAPH